MRKLALISAGALALALSSAHAQSINLGAVVPLNNGRGAAVYGGINVPLLHGGYHRYPGHGQHFYPPPRYHTAPQVIYVPAPRCQQVWQPEIMTEYVNGRATRSWQTGRGRWATYC